MNIYFVIKFLKVSAAPNGINACVALKLTTHQQNSAWLAVSGCYQNRPTTMLIYAHAYTISPKLPVWNYAIATEKHAASVFGWLLIVVETGKIKKCLNQAFLPTKIYGKFTIHSADALEGTKHITQKIPFGGTEYFELLALWAVAGFSAHCHDIIHTTKIYYITIASII